MAFEFEIRAGIDTKQLEADLNNAKSDIERSLRLSAAGAKPGEVSQRIRLEAEGNDRGLGNILKVLRTETSGLTKEQLELLSSLKKLTDAEKGSATQARNLLAYQKQQLNATRYGTEAWDKQEKAVRAAQSAYNAAQGIFRGSVTQLQQEAALLRQTSQNRVLDAASRDQLNQKILANNAAQRQASGIEQGSVADKRALLAELTRLSEQYATGSARQLQYANAAKQVKASLDGQKAGFSGIISALGKIATVQAGFVAVQSLIGQAAGTVNQFIGQAKAVEGFTLSLQNVGLSAGEANVALKQASTTANALGAPVQQVEKAYRRMVPALKAVGASSQETDKFIEGIAARSQTLGLSTEESGRFMEAFAQVLSKGKLQAEELNQQISELDGSFRVQLADSLGVTTAELEKMIQNSEVTADVFVKSFNQMQNGADALKARVQAGNLTIQQLQNIIQNLAVENLRTIGAAIEPGIKAFLDIGRVFGEFVRDITKTEFGKFLANSFNGAIIGIRNFIQGLLLVVKTIASLLAPFFALINAINSLLEPLGGIVGVIAPFIAALITLKAASIGLTSVLNLGTKFREFTAGMRSAAVASKILALAFRDLQKNNLAGALGKLPALLKNISSTLAQSTAKWLGFGDAAQQGIAKAFAGLGKGRPKIPVPQAIGPALPPSYIKQFPQYAKATMQVEAANAAMAASARQAAGAAGAQGAAAGAAGVGTAGLSASVVGLSVAFAAVAVAASGAYLVWREGQKIQNKLGESTKELDTYLKSLGAEVQKQPTFWGSLSSKIKEAGNAIFKFFAEGSQVDGAKKAQNDYNASIGTGIMELNKLGIELGKGAKNQNISNESLKDGLKLSEKLRDAAVARAAALKELIAEEENSGNANGKLAQALRAQLTEAEVDVKVLSKTNAAIKKNIEERKKQAGAAAEVVSSLEELIDIEEQETRAAQQSTIKNDIALLKQYGISIKDTAKLELARAVNAVEGEKNILEARKKSLAEQKKFLAQEEAKDNADQEKIAKIKENISKLELQITQSEQTVAEGARNLASTFIDTFEKIAQEGTKVSDTYKNISTSLASAVDSVRSSGTSVIGSLKGLVDQVAEREIQGLEVGSARRKEIITEQLKTQKILNDLQYQIDTAKLQAAYRLQQIEIQTVKSRLEAEAAIARARGDNKSAQALDKAAGAQNELLRLSGVQFQLDQKNLDLQKRSTNEILAQKAISEGIQPANIGISDQDRATFQQINQDIQEIKGILKEISTSGIDLNSIQAAEESFQAQADATNELKNNLNGTPELLQQGLTAADGMKSSLDGVAEAASTANQNIQQLVTAMQEATASLGGNARWMGGPVSAGQTYTVNDNGLGREAFVNSFGRMSMLPAGRNLQWTAPTSGTIIPANIVNQMKNNSDINAAINVASRKGEAAVSRKATTANSIDSGNLIQRVASAMSSSGNTQRITNNVTIQSQEPVTDASKIMTNVARMKLRNSRRI